VSARAAHVLISGECPVTSAAVLSRRTGSEKNLIGEVRRRHEGPIAVSALAATKSDDPRSISSDATVGG